MEFSSYINERTQYFTGRDWVFKAINDWNWSRKVESRIFLLVGGPGTGKTAIAAKLAQISDGTSKIPIAPDLIPGWLTYSHFCQAGLDSTLSPLSFVQSLSETLANRYPAFRVSLEKAASPQIVINQNVTAAEAGSNITGVEIGQVRVEIKNGDARPLFDQAVRVPLKDLCNGLFMESIIILVDSLDEALTFNPENNITQLLKLVNDFPPQVRFVFTCRSNSERVFNLLGRPTLDLIADAPPGRDEVEIYGISRLRDMAEPQRSELAKRVAEKSRGNFLYAFHVLNDLISHGDIGDPNAIALPDELDDVYRKFIQREMASNPTKWSDVYRPLLGPIAVALGDGLTRAQLIGITDLAEDTTDDVLKVCAQYLVGGELKAQPYRIYHQSFRDFLLTDDMYSVYPAERHATIARYFQEEFGSNWTKCNDTYGLRYTPLHWADSATLSATKREVRTQSLVTLTSNKKYQAAFETQVGDLPVLQDYLHRAVKVASLNDRDDMLPWLIKAAKRFGDFRETHLRGEGVVALAEQGLISQAEKRLTLFADLDEDWKAAARLIIGWLGIERNKDGAQQLRDGVAASLSSNEPLLILRDRFDASLNNQSSFSSDENDPLSLEVGREVVKRVGGQDFDQELLGSVSPSFITNLGLQSELLNNATYGYASNFDGPILVQMARVYGQEGTELVDAYIDAHAGYNYVEYRNRSLWMVMHSVLRNHPDQGWVRERLRRLLVAALSGGAIDFGEMLPMTAALLTEKANQGDPRPLLEGWYAAALENVQELQNRRRSNDSWGNHKRRLTALMELYHLILVDRNKVDDLVARISDLPSGFAGFQAPAILRVADALVVCRQTGSVEKALDDCFRAAHNIQDYHFCARITARCNALKRWHQASLSGQTLADTIGRLAASPSNPEFAAHHFIHEPYEYRNDGPQTLSAYLARQAETLEQLVEVFQRPAVEFRRLNPQFGLTEKLAGGTLILIPDPGLPPLLAVHLAAAVMADDGLTETRAALIQSLVPSAVNNPTTLDTVLSYLLIAINPDDSEILEEIVDEIGPVEVVDVTAPTLYIGPDPPDEKMTPAAYYGMLTKIKS
jgi:hypothetical protein